MIIGNLGQNTWNDSSLPGEHSVAIRRSVCESVNRRESMFHQQYGQLTAAWAEWKKIRKIKFKMTKTKLIFKWHVLHQRLIQEITLASQWDGYLWKYQTPTLRCCKCSLKTNLRSKNYKNILWPNQTPTSSCCKFFLKANLRSKDY
jgi:hypothetical protein